MGSVGWPRTLAFGIALSLSLSVKVPLQNPTGQSETKVALVQLFVSVNDDQGKPVPDMKREEFQVIEGSTIQQIATLKKANEVPLTVGLMIDESRSRRSQLLGGEREGASLFLAEVIRQHGVAFIGTFADEPYFDIGITGDVSALQRYLKKDQAFWPSGSSAPSLAIVQASSRVLSGRAGRRVLVITTDGIDNSGYSTKLHRRLQPQDVAETLSSQRTILFVILLQVRGDLTDRGERESGARIFTSLAESTGGRAIVVDSLPKFTEAFLEIAAEINAQYLVEFISGPAPASAEPRHIRVETTRKDVHLRMPRRYVPRP